MAPRFANVFFFFLIVLKGFLFVYDQYHELKHFFGYGFRFFGFSVVFLLLILFWSGFRCCS